MHLVGSVRVPDDELSVLRGGNEMPAVGSPVHGIDLGEVTAQGTARAHDDTGKSRDLVGHRTHCTY